MPETSSWPLGRAKESSSSKTITQGKMTLLFEIFHVLLSPIRLPILKVPSGPRTTIYVRGLMVARDFAMSVFHNRVDQRVTLPLGRSLPYERKLSGSLIDIIRLSYNVLFAWANPPTSSHFMRETST